MRLSCSFPDLNESLDGPPHEVRDLSIADLDDAVSSVRPTCHVHTEERAWNRARTEYDWFRDGRARLGGIRRSVQDEVSPLGVGYKVLDAADAKTALDKTSILLHFRVVVTVFVMGPPLAASAFRA